MANIKSIINIHDIEVITERKHKSAHFPINAKLPNNILRKKNIKFSKLSWKHILRNQRI